MIELRPYGRLGGADHGWLDTKHHFSFADYYDPDRVHWGNLRVWNDDEIAPGTGFPLHPHRDMEIITYVVAGTVEHRDSLGHVQQIGAGELQRMTAGTGIVHSEYNPSGTEPLHFLQIWIRPAREGLEPGYEQRAVPAQEGLTWLVSGDHLPDTLHVHQDVRLGRVSGAGGQTLPLADGRVGFLHVVKGSAEFADKHLRAGDAVAVTEVAEPRVTLAADSEVLWFDLPGYPAP